MPRFLAVAVSFLLMAACAPAPSAAPVPSTDLGALAARVAERMREMGTAAYRTESTWFGQSGANVDTTVAGVWRQDGAGISATMRVRRGVGGTFHEVVTVVLVPGKLYASAGDRWSLLTDQDGAEKYYSVLGGLSLASTVGAELDYLEPEAATVKSIGHEDVDGVATTRYDLEIDPGRMAPLFRDPYRLRKHDDLAADHATITAAVWLDESGLPVKASSLLPFQQPKGSTTWFTGWGRPVEIVEPPADQVIPG